MLPVKFTVQSLKGNKEIEIKDHMSLLEACHKNNLNLEGACEGSLACSTCHVILTENAYKKYNNISEKEYDLLDGVFGNCDTSRLACQIPVDYRLNNEIIKIPKASKNFYVDGFQPKHH